MFKHLDKPSSQLPASDPQADAWAGKNTWFGQDRGMTFTAFEIHKDLVDKEGFDPKSDEYYAEVDKRIRVDFPHKFGTSDNKYTTEPVQTVASAKKKREAWSQNCETHFFTGSNS